MAVDSAQVDLWRTAPTETQNPEFKEAKTGYDLNKTYEYCVAIANEGGGHLVLGVSNTPPREVVGTTAANDPVGMAQKLFRKLGFRVDVDAVDHPDGRVVVFSIPSRPVGTAYSLEGKYLMRSGESLVPMSEDQLRRIFAEGEPSWLEQPAATGLTAEDVVSLLEVETYFELSGLAEAAGTPEHVDRLLQDRLIDQSDGRFSIRRMGALLLARNLADFPDLERKAPRLVVYDGKSKLSTRLEEKMSQGYAVGFRSLVHSVVAQLPQNEIIEDALRRQVKLVPDDVVRELVANALIHQDFNVGGSSVMIEVYDDRVDFSNPGEPVVDVSRFIDSYQSRNERMASIMRRFGICEEKSSGIDRVVHAVEAYQLPAPEFRVSGGRTVATVYGHKPFDDMDRSDRVRACYQHCVLKYVMGEFMTNSSLRERFGLPLNKQVVTSQVISIAVDEGWVCPDARVGGSKKYARYLPCWAVDTH
ncbi:MAG: putative DNA binding domain-containing protein [Coriobacteriia bacterium]|nr:putative DNA binding domain-containing protein [Coriobacteriia bacterium]